MIRKSHSWSLEPSSNEIVGVSGASIPALKSDLRFLRRILHGRRNLASGTLSSGVWASVPSVYRIAALVGCSESVFIRVHPWFRSFVYALLFKFPFAIVRVLFAIIRIRSRTFAIIRDISTPPPPTAIELGSGTHLRMYNVNTIAH